ncbi:hypothetical protein [Streptomyces sp. NPDC052811]
MEEAVTPAESEPSDTRRFVNTKILTTVMVGVGTLMTGVAAVITAFR